MSVELDPFLMLVAQALSARAGEPFDELTGERFDERTLWRWAEAGLLSEAEVDALLACRKAAPSAKVIASILGVLAPEAESAPAEDWSWELNSEGDKTLQEPAVQPSASIVPFGQAISAIDSAEVPTTEAARLPRPVKEVELAAAASVGSQAGVARLSTGGWSWDEGPDLSISSSITSATPLSPMSPRASRFQLGEAIGKTHFCDVHAVRDRLLGRDLVAYLLRADAPFNERSFVRAVRLQAGLQHPNVQPVYELSRSPDGRLFFSTARSLPDTLATVLKAVAQDDAGARAQWSTVRLVEVLLDASRAVAFAHQRGVMHRDLRPAHVHLGRLGEVQVSGWERARLRAQPPDFEEDTLLNPVGGGLGYLAPERLKNGLTSCGASADVWGLGALLYAVLTWRPPFAGRSSTDLLNEIASGRLVSPGDRRGGQIESPPLLEDLCKRALEFDPQKRRLAAEEFAAEIENFLEGTRALERQLERATERIEDATKAASLFGAARDKLQHAVSQSVAIRWQSGGLALDPSLAQAARTLVERYAAEVETAFTRADEAWARAIAEAPALDQTRHGLCALYFDALQLTEAGDVRLPAGYLRAGIRQYDPGPFLDALSRAATLEVRSSPTGLQVRLHPLSESEGQLVPESGRHLGRTPVTVPELPPGTYLVVVGADEGSIRVPVFLNRGEQLTVDVPVPAEVPPGMAYVAPGPFIVGEGGDGGLLRESLPLGRCRLPGFFIATTPVTFEEYGEFLNALNRGTPLSAQARAPRRFAGSPPFWRVVLGEYRLPFTDSDGRSFERTMPVVGLTAEDVLAYCSWRGRRDRQPYRLPTELEWEKAARGADGRIYPWGNRAVAAFCHHRLIGEELPALAPVGSVAQDASIYGVMDLAGGVREHTDSHFPGERQVLRGGSWRLPFAECRLSTRTPLTASTPLDAVGFRLAQDAPGEKRSGAWPRFEPMPTLPLPSLSDRDDDESIIDALPSVELTVEGKSLFQLHVGVLPPGVRRREPAGGEGPSFTELGPERYIIIEEMARGSMGRVVLAFDHVLERQVALKILHDKHRDDKLSRYRFVMEARITGRLQHTSIMPIYDFGTLPNGDRFFAMKPVEGQALSDILRHRATGDVRVRTDFTRDRLLNVFRRICMGVAFAHESGVVHRDLKPANVLIGEYGEVALVDLGLARLLSPDPSDQADVMEIAELAQADGRVTRIGSVIGTPYYMSPEQAMGLQDLVGPLSDVYGLGAILFHILALRPPYSGKKVNEVLAKVRRGNPRPPSSVAPEEDIGRELDEIVLKALSMDPALRQSSAVQLAHDIEVFQDGARAREMERVVIGGRATRAGDAMARYDEAWQTLSRHMQLRKRYEAEIHIDDAVSRKAPLWQARERESLLIEEVETRLTEAVRLGRLALSPERPDVRDRLAEMLMNHARRAEAVHDDAGAAWCARLLTRIDEDGLFSAWLRSGAALSIHTTPPGLMVGVFRCREVDRRLVPDDVVHRGPAPVELAALPIGSYVALVNRLGVSLRLPFVVERDNPIELHLTWPGPALLRPGFAFVAQGEFFTGGDLDTHEPLQFSYLPDFALAIHPVTCLEYHEFLDDLRVRNSRESEVHQPRTLEGGPLIWGPEGEKLVGRFSPHRPVSGITLDNALAYCAWRSQRDGWTYRLPGTLEWEKAMRGVDGRRFPWGHRFDPAWTRDDNHQLHDVGHFAEDVSPYGVCDMATGVMEWTQSSVSPGSDVFIVRGQSAAAPLHSAPGTSVMTRPRKSRSPFVGFRLMIGG
ncbi:MAG: hypothetical protein EXR76_04720 [Myxococcales bacterium]|nr:hypothetical protein [Myxococcales bacterium]